jgi:hypothetical protein
MQRHLILVCHAADGYFADGNREAVREVLDRSDCVQNVTVVGVERYQIKCADGGQFELQAPGLDGTRAFHRMELSLDSDAWTANLLKLILELMRAGGFGLMDSLEASQFIVTMPQQINYFPWLPEPPLLVQNSRDLGYSIL